MPAQIDAERWGQARSRQPLSCAQAGAARPIEAAATTTESTVIVVDDDEADLAADLPPTIGSGSSCNRSW
jgi:hypothetical protein